MVENAGARRDAEVVCLLPRHQKQRGSTVRDLGRVAGRDRAVLLERGLQRRKTLERRLGADALVGGEDVAVDRIRKDLALEPSLLSRAGGTLLRAERDLIAILAGDGPLLGDELRAETLVDERKAIEELLWKR